MATEYVNKFQITGVILDMNEKKTGVRVGTMGDKFYLYCPKEIEAMTAGLKPGDEVQAIGRVENKAFEGKTSIGFNVTNIKVTNPVVK